MRSHTILLSTLGFACAPIVASAQTDITHAQQEILLLEATPIGALPPIALPMPASRNHSYWAFRLQAGDRESPGESGLPAFAGCGGHTLFGVRSRINLMTGGQTFGSLFHDPSSTTTLGGEVGFGYAPNVVSGMAACSLDFGVPITISFGQTIRIASFLTPGIMWDLNCSGPESPSRPAYLTGFGIGIQQLGSRGLDVYLGVQKIYRRDSGFQIGVSVTYVRLP